MKKLTLALFMLIAASLSAQYKLDGCYIYLVNPASETLSWENDTLKFSFEPWTYYWRTTIENKSDKPAVVDWESSAFAVNRESCEIILEDELFAEKSTITPKTFIRKEVRPKGMHQVFWRRGVKQADLPIKITLVIDGKAHEFDFNITMHHQ